MAAPSETDIQRGYIVLQGDLQSEGDIFRRKQGLVDFGLFSVGMWIAPEWVMASQTQGSIRYVMNMLALQTCLNPGYEVPRGLREIKPFVSKLLRKNRPEAPSLVDRIRDIKQRLGIIIDGSLNVPRDLLQPGPQRKHLWVILGVAVVNVETDYRSLIKDINYIRSYDQVPTATKVLAIDNLSWIIRNQTLDQYVDSTGYNEGESVVEKLMLLQRIAASSNSESKRVSPLVVRDITKYLDYALGQWWTNDPITYEAYQIQTRQEKRRAVERKYMQMAVRYLVGI